MCETGLQKVVKIIGSQGLLAREIGFTQSAVCQAARKENPATLDLGIAAFVAVNGDVPLQEIIGQEKFELVKQAAELIK